MITEDDTDQLDRPQVAEALGVSPRVLSNLAKRKKARRTASIPPK
jgi:hypothetical protein